MQTFLPYASFEKSARVLDNKRLGKQRVEVIQILRALAGQTRGWRNHPATRMWIFSELELVRYGLAICSEWMQRGFNDTCYDKILEFADHPGFGDKAPSWVGREDFHISHRSNLIRKDPAHYGKFWPDIPPTLPYVWPL